MRATRFDLSPKEAIELQKQLREEVVLSGLTSRPKLVAGCDVSMNRFAKDGHAGFVTMGYPDMAIQEVATIEDTLPFPYVPGLLSFREIPMLLKAWAKLKIKPELIFVDGVGVAHPRGLGIASHLGLILGVPTIGCAKSVLVGAYEEPNTEPGSTSPLIDRRTGEMIGTAVRTKRGVRPMFISPGHLVSHTEAVELVLGAVLKHRLPEPTRQAHLAVNEARVAASIK